jgi:hypothetical protein
VSLVHIGSLVLSFIIADEERNAKSNVKITQNEACLLQNQVRQQNQALFNEFF